MSKDTTEKTLTAAQRMEVLEKSLATLDQALMNLTRQTQMMQDALGLLNDKVSAMVVALSSGLSVSEESINQINTDMKVTEMKAKVEKLLADGIVAKSDEVTKNSFVVVREIDMETGNVINPRLQFVARVLNDDSLSKVIGKKAGESVKLADDASAAIEIEEVYEIQSAQGSQTTEAGEQAQTQA